MNLKTAENFCRRMGIALRAGVDLLKALEAETRVGDGRHRRAIGQVIELVRGGHTLSQALAAQAGYFPRLLVQLVDAAEMGGRLEAVFLYMADYYHQLRETRSQFFSQVRWPLIQLVLAVGIIGLVILLQGILSPTSTYDASGLGLRGVEGFLSYCMVVGTVAGLVALVIYGIWKNWLGCHRVLVPLVQRIPVLGTAFVTLALSRLSMTLSILLNAGVDARTAIGESFLATGNHYFIRGAGRAMEAVREGKSFAEAFAASGVMPEEFIEAVQVSELSGTETESLDHLAKEYQRRAAAAMSTIATVASLAIWLSILMLIAFMILRMALNYVNMLNSFLP
ncbi:MAG: type II secretion system protein F [Pirellulaceae bacterium]|nr:MAG: type II secretion system protein F [Pirellulaceae bacterium]